MDIYTHWLDGIYITDIIASSFVIIIFAYFNIRGNKLSSKLQYIFSIILFLSIVILALHTFLNTNLHTQNMKPYFSENKSISLSIISIITISP